MEVNFFFGVFLMGYPLCNPGALLVIFQSAGYWERPANKTMGHL